ncbi:class I SAM-dependent methyltransferase family protein [Actinoplanes philippinensis]|uniref:class I SAM-dependent methyltransferase family protein n=1 Tax=Actinoplanes philippinensis TaxID=35752 RepID=UPI0033F9022F
MGGDRDWHDWHRDYADPGSALARRLRVVQGHIGAWLDERPEPGLTVVSMCAGQGHDLLEVLAARPDAARVRATLIEFDGRNVAAARARAAAAGLDGVTVREADAGDLAAYREAVPADLVLMAGVLGNIDDAGVRRTVATLPSLCAPGATVIWTRTRRAPDLTPAIREWLGEAGFAELAFTAPGGVLFAVGAHRFTGTPEPLPAEGRIFRFR